MGWSGLAFICCRQGLEVYNKDVAVTLLGAMYADAADFTNTFRSLSSVSSLPSDEDINGIPAALFKVPAFRGILRNRRMRKTLVGMTSSGCAKETWVI